jgi:hypothetical protein
MIAVEQLALLLQDGLNQDDEAASADEAVTLIDVLPYLGRALGLRGLACLAGSSRQFRQVCLTLAESNARILLLDALPAVKTGDDLAATAVAAAAALLRKQQGFH